MDQNLEDIARLAGVSRSTVSRVINNNPNVSASTRQRVLQIIQEQQYRPNYFARALATRRTRIIGVVIPYTPLVIFDEARYFSAMLQGITEVMDERDYVMLLWLSQPEDTKNLFYERVIAQHRLMDGLILASISLDDPLQNQLLDIGMPFVLLERPGQRFIDHISYVTVDNIGGAQEAVNHLLSLGRRRIGTITGLLSHPDGQDRLMGYRQALENNGIPFDPVLVAEGHFDLDSGYEGMRELLRAGVDAVFAGSDITAIGAMRAIKEVGLRIPEDVAIVGFDDLPTAVNVSPRLSTVHQPIPEKGALAASLLLDSIEGEDKVPSHRLLPTRLIVRESSGMAQLENIP